MARTAAHLSVRDHAFGVEVTNGKRWVANERVPGLVVNVIRIRFVRIAAAASSASSASASAARRGRAVVLADVHPPGVLCDRAGGSEHADDLRFDELVHRRKHRAASRCGHTCSPGRSRRRCEPTARRRSPAPRRRQPASTPPGPPGRVRCGVERRPSRSSCRRPQLRRASLAPPRAPPAFSFSFAFSASAPVPPRPNPPPSLRALPRRRRRPAPPPPLPPSSARRTSPSAPQDPDRLLCRLPPDARHGSRSADGDVEAAGAGGERAGRPRSGDGGEGRCLPTRAERRPSRLWRRGRRSEEAEQEGSASGEETHTVKRRRRRLGVLLRRIMGVSHGSALPSRRPTLDRAPSPAPPGSPPPQRPPLDIRETLGAAVAAGSAVSRHADGSRNLKSTRAARAWSALRRSARTCTSSRMRFAEDHRRCGAAPPGDGAPSPAWPVHDPDTTALAQPADTL